MGRLDDQPRSQVGRPGVAPRAGFARRPQGVGDAVTAAAKAAESRG